MSGIFSEKVIRNKKMEEQDVREYLQICKMMEAVDKAHGSVIWMLPETAQRPPEVAKIAEKTEKAANDTLQYLKKATNENTAGQKPEKKHKHRQPSRDEGMER